VQPWGTARIWTIRGRLGKMGRERSFWPANPVSSGITRPGPPAPSDQCITGKTLDDPIDRQVAVHLL
jgi:hypothetical protein